MNEKLTSDIVSALGSGGIIGAVLLFLGNRWTAKKTGEQKLIELLQGETKRLSERLEGMEKRFDEQEKETNALKAALWEYQRCTNLTCPLRSNPPVVRP